jgi:hypothetical protein
MVEHLPAVTATQRRFVPATCPYCAYDRQFPGFEGGGWIEMPNNGPIVSCPLCNDDGASSVSATQEKSHD